VWKGATETISSTGVISVATASDPAKNGFNLGGGPAPPSGTQNEGYGAAISWTVADLGVQEGRTYRVQFMVHDGDQNKSGGDVGEQCAIVHISRTPPCPPAEVASSTTIAATESNPSTAPAVDGTPAAAPMTESLGLPRQFMLMQNFPNPFKFSTTIRYALPEASRVQLAVYNILGERVATLVDGVVEAGDHSAVWNATGTNGRALAPGMYMYRMQATSVRTGVFKQLKKMVLVK